MTNYTNAQLEQQLTDINQALEKCLENYVEYEQKIMHRLQNSVAVYEKEHPNEALLCASVLSDIKKIKQVFDMHDIAYDPFLALGEACYALHEKYKNTAPGALIEAELVQFRREGLLYRSYEHDIRPEVEKCLRDAKAFIKSQKNAKLAAWNDAFLTCFQLSLNSRSKKSYLSDHTDLLKGLFFVMQCAIIDAEEGRLTTSSLHVSCKEEMELLKLYPDVLAAFEQGVATLLETKGWKYKRLRAQTYQPTFAAISKMRDAVSDLGWLSYSPALAWAENRHYLLHEKMQVEAEISYQASSAELEANALKQAHETVFKKYLGKYSLKAYETKLKALVADQKTHAEFWADLLLFLNKKYQDESGVMKFRSWGGACQQALCALDELQMHLPFEQQERPLMVTEFDKILAKTYRWTWGGRSLEREQQLEDFRYALSQAGSPNEALRLVEDAMAKISFSHSQTSTFYNFNLWKKPSRAVKALESFRTACLKNQWASSPAIRQYHAIEQAFKSDMEAYFSRFWFVDKSERQVVNAILQSIITERQKCEAQRQSAEQGLEKISRIISSSITNEENHFKHKNSTLCWRYLGFKPLSTFALALKKASTRATNSGVEIKVFAAEKKQMVLTALRLLLQQFMRQETKVNLFGQVDQQFENERLEALAHLRILINCVEEDAFTIDLATLFVATTTDYLEMACPNNLHFSNSLCRTHKQLTTAGALLSTKAVTTDEAAKNNALCHSLNRLKTLYTDKLRLRKEADQAKMQIGKMARFMSGK